MSLALILDVILKNSSLEGHSVLSDKSGNLHSNFRSFASSKLPQSSLDNPLFSSQSLECQKDGEKNVSCIADTKTQQSLTQDTRIADTCHSEALAEESKTTQAQQSSLRENKQSAVSLENPQDFLGKTSQQRSFFSDLKSSTTESQTLLDSIINDKGFESQVKEWQELKLVEEDISLEDMKSIVLSLQKISKESSAICHSKAVTEESFSPRHSELHSSEESKSNTRDSKKDVSGLHPQHDENRHSDSVYRHSDLEQSESEESLVIANEESVTESIKDSSFATQIQNDKIGHNDTASTTGGGGETMPLKCVDSSIVLDFFVGSGTTIATAHKLGRKWLGVEMGEHFYKVIIPRMKKVIGGFVSGISKEVEFKGGGAFRYYELESYEESLANCEYVLDSSLDRESNKDILPTAQYDKAENFQYDRVGGSQYNKTESHQYTKTESHSDKISRHIELPIRHSDLEQSEREESKDTKYSIINYRKSRKLIKGLKKGEAISLDMSGYRKDFDILHTMANILGLKIQRLFLDSKGIECVEFDNGDRVSSDNVDLCKYPKLTKLIWWER